MVIGVDGVIGVHAVHQVVTAPNTDQEFVTIPPQLMVALLARDRPQKLLIVRNRSLFITWRVRRILGRDHFIFLIVKWGIIQKINMFGRGDHLRFGR